MLYFPLGGFGQENWPHSVNDWDNKLFQARVQGVYDWVGSGPDRLTTLEFTEVAINMYQLATVNRELETFPPRDEIDPELKFFPPPKDWEDRKNLILHFSRNPELEAGYFEDKLDEKAGPDTHYLMGNIYFLQNKYTEAIESYLAAIEEFPRFRLAFKNMSYAYFILGDCDKALPAAKKATELGAFTAHLKGVEAYCSLQQGSYHSAAEAIALARMLDHENETWLELEIEAFIKLGRYPQAKILLNNKVSFQGAIGQHFDGLTEIARGEDDQETLFAMLEIKKRSGAITESELVELNGMKISKGVARLIDNDGIGEYLKQTSPSLNELIEILNSLVTSSDLSGALEFSNNVLDQTNFGLTAREGADLSVMQARVFSKFGSFELALGRLENVLENFPIHCEALLLGAEIQVAQQRNDLADTYLHRAENSSSECSDEVPGRQAKILLDRGDYAQSYELYQIESRQQLIEGTIEKKWHGNMIEALANLVQLNPR